MGIDIDETRTREYRVRDQKVKRVYRATEGGQGVAIAKLPQCMKEEGPPNGLDNRRTFIQGNDYFILVFSHNRV